MKIILRGVIPLEREGGGREREGGGQYQEGTAFGNVIIS